MTPCADCFTWVCEGCEHEEGAKMNEWIRVEDRLPDIEENVLGYSDGSIEVINRDIDYGWTKCDREYGVHNVTHWMPLPEPPK